MILVALMLSGFVGKAQLDIEKCDCSKSYNEADCKCSNAIDGNNATAWNSGAGAPQWIKLTLSIAHDIKKITWVNAIQPNGEVSMEFKFFNEGGELISTENKTFDCVSHETNTASVNIPGVKIVKVTIKKSPSWIALYDIALF